MTIWLVLPETIRMYEFQINFKHLPVIDEDRWQRTGKTKLQSSDRLFEKNIEQNVIEEAITPLFNLTIS